MAVGGCLLARGAGMGAPVVVKNSRLGARPLDTHLQ